MFAVVLARFSIFEVIYAVAEQRLVSFNSCSPAVLTRSVHSKPKVRSTFQASRKQVVSATAFLQ